MQYYLHFLDPAILAPVGTAVEIAAAVVVAVDVTIRVDYKRVVVTACVRRS